MSADDLPYLLAPRSSLTLRLFGLAMFVYTVAIGIALIVAPGVICGSVIIATTIIVIWAGALTILVMEQTKEAKANEERRKGMEP